VNQLRYAFIVSLFICGVSFSATWVPLSEEQSQSSVSIIEGEISRTVINYTINGYNYDRIFIDGRSFSLLQHLEGESIIENEGYPRLPRINRTLRIPDEGVMGYEIISSDYIEIQNIDIAPSKGRILRSTDPATVAYNFADVYQKDEFYPGSLITIQKPFILRDFRGVTVELNAFQYNPVSRVLRIYTNATVEIRKIASGGENTLIRNAPLTKLDPQFKKMYQSRFTNQSAMDYPTLEEFGGMLIICYDNFLQDMSDFVDWKIQRGIDTEIVPISSIGNDWVSIKRYIRDYYNSHDLTYVVLVGDSAQVAPVPYEDGSDPIYALLAGDDLYPEVFIGRLSAETDAEVLTQVERTIQYEKYPEIGGDWYRRGFGSASDQGAGAGHYGEADHVHVTLMANKLLDHTYTHVDSSYAPWGTPAITDKFVNAGIGIFLYCGHGAGQAWDPPYYGINNVRNLTNNNRLPFIINVACSTGDFGSITCFAEAWLRATDIHTGEPTGAIGAYMSRTSMGWTPGMYMQDEAVDLWVADSMWTFGGLCFNGSMYMIENDPPWGNGEFKYLTVFGDPSVSLRGDTPFELDVTHADAYLVGAQSAEITVLTEFGNPYESVLVCLSNEAGIIASGVTNSAGIASLQWEEGLTAAGSVKLTVSGGDAVPCIVDIPVIQPSSAYIEVTDYSIDDQITGNGNGQLDFYETAGIGLTLANHGISSAESLYCIAEVDHPQVTLNSDSVWIGTLSPDETIDVDDAFNLTVDPSIGDSEPIIFATTIRSSTDEWLGNFTIPVHAPDIQVVDLLIDDTTGGNGDSLLAPGETAEIRLALGNTGSYICEAVDLELSCSNPLITILDSTAYCETIPPYMNQRVSFSITASPDFTVFGREIPFNLAVSGEHGYSNFIEIPVVVGDAVCNPTGPDDYGYTAYDRFDAPYFTEYNWIEISADSGGHGEFIPFSGLDGIEHVPLPFPFRFYGETYQDVSICTKGYICMGITNEIDYTFTYIPSPDGPGAFVAPYWDDLYPAEYAQNSGGVWYYYDPEQHIFIVEFNHSPHWYITIDTHCTFQTILYDPRYYPTLTGDGQIKFQYKETFFTPVEWSGTAGIENQTEDVGLNFRYLSLYPATCATVEAGTAIFITTPVNPPEVNIALSPDTPPIAIPAEGGSFSYDVDLTNDDSASAFLDVWFDVILPDGTDFGPLLNKENVILQPGENLYRTMLQEVPGGAQEGTYSYRVKVGIYPDIVYTTDSFTFEKSGVDGSDSDGTGWSLSGWSDELANDNIEVPTTYSLQQNYPNPFNPVTTIRYGLPEAGNVEITIYNTLGQEICKLVDGYRQAGYHVVSWDASNLSSGLYFYRLETGDFVSVRKMVLVK